jgi:hypothetical protein
VAPHLQVKLQQDLALKEMEAQVAKVFRANPVPAAVTQPRYASILEAQERRRQESHARNAELLAARERPFSFYGRWGLTEGTGTLGSWCCWLVGGGSCWRLSPSESPGPAQQQPAASHSMPTLSAPLPIPLLHAALVVRRQLPNSATTSCHCSCCSCM